MNKYAAPHPLPRSIGLTNFELGKNDLSPVPRDLDRFQSVMCDFEAASFHFPALAGENTPAFSPGYVTLDHYGQKRVFSDILVFEILGLSTHHGQGWLEQNNISGAIYSTALASLLQSYCLLLIVLNRPVNESTYTRLWTKFAKDLFAGSVDIEQSDCRHRFLYPRTSTGKPTLLSHTGHPLHVEWALSRPTLAGEVLGQYFAEHSYDFWPESEGAPFDR